MRRHSKTLTPIRCVRHKDYDISWKCGNKCLKNAPTFLKIYYPYDYTSHHMWNHIPPLLWMKFLTAAGSIRRCTNYNCQKLPRIGTYLYQRYKV